MFAVPLGGVPSVQPLSICLFARMVPEWFPVCNPPKGSAFVCLREWFRNGSQYVCNPRLRLRKTKPKPLQPFPFEERGQRAQATRLERNDGSTVTASGLGLNSHTPPSAVLTARCVPRRIACRVLTDACVNGGGVWHTFAGHWGNLKLKLQAANCESPI